MFPARNKIARATREGSSVSAPDTVWIGTESASDLTWATSLHPPAVKARAVLQAMRTALGLMKLALKAASLLDPVQAFGNRSQTSRQRGEPTPFKAVSRTVNTHLCATAKNSLWFSGSCGRRCLRGPGCSQL